MTVPFHLRRHILQACPEFLFGEVSIFCKIRRYFCGRCHAGSMGRAAYLWFDEKGFCRMKKLVSTLSAAMMLSFAFGAITPAMANHDHGKPAPKKDSKPAAKAKACANCKKAKHPHAAKCCGKCKKHDDAHGHGHAKH
jgi:hypothetical protein